MMINFVSIIWGFVNNLNLDGGGTSMTTTNNIEMQIEYSREPEGVRLSCNGGGPAHIFRAQSALTLSRSGMQGCEEHALTYI